MKRERLIAIAEEVCTDKEREALAYHFAGVSIRRIAVTLGISRSTVRSRLENATRKIVNHPDYPEEAA